ncbi:MAG: hypothetical protein JXA57_12080 [Armatimonadetes bacterium]|nr:hypothetical protein [Armatimonadota bacterium]
MAEVNLTQSEADALIAMEKCRVDETPHDFPGAGVGISIPLASADRREAFVLDLWRGRIDLQKARYQNRARQVVLLVRVDLVGPPHRNPDGQEIPCPHLHLYRENHGLKWAVALPKDLFADPGDLWQTLEDFMRYCHITKPPNIVPKML